MKETALPKNLKMGGEWSLKSKGIRRRIMNASRLSSQKIEKKTGITELVAPAQLAILEENMGVASGV